MRRTLSGLLLLLIPFCIFSQSIYDLSPIRSIQIQYYNPAYDSILQSHWQLQDGHREMARLTMDGILYDSVGIRYKGNSTFGITQQQGLPKFPLNIDMNEYVKGQKLLDSKKLKLANSIFDPTFVKEYLAYSIYRKYMPASRVNYLRVNTNNSYTGLYVNVEPVNKDFLERHFDYKKGTLFKCDPIAQFGTTPTLEPDLSWLGTDSTAYFQGYELKSDEGWNDLVELIDVLNNRPNDIETVLNVDRVLWYLAVSMVIPNLDMYNGYFVHNFYLYKHKNGLFQIIPWDLSESFGGILLNLDYVDENDIVQYSPFHGGDPFVSRLPLVHKLLIQEEYRLRYGAHLRTVIEEVYDTTLLATEINQIQASIESLVMSDVNRVLPDDAFRGNVRENLDLPIVELGGILNIVNQRKPFLLGHPEIAKIAPQITGVRRNIESPEPGESVWVRASIDQATEVSLMTTISEYNSHFLSTPMFDDGQHQDGAANDGIYGAEIPHKDLGTIVKYYVKARNVDAMMLNPRRAEYEFYSYGLGTTGIADEQLEPFQVFPNPASSRIQLDAGETSFLKGKLMLLDLRGKPVFEKEISGAPGSFTLDLPQLAKGIYLIHMEGKMPQRLMIR
ncbi:MAG: CotH kinase family protein [Bacteroidia bacterium]|nr:CotH kinase family protein [Bacteroidia bacterium]